MRRWLQTTGDAARSFAGGVRRWPNVPERPDLRKLVALVVVGLTVLVFVALPRANDGGRRLSSSRTLLAAPVIAAPEVNIHQAEPSELGFDVDCAACHALPRSVAGSADVYRSVKGICLQCHRQQEEQLAEVSSHPPFKNGECTACHQVHRPAARDGTPPFLLKAPTGDLCLTCHAEKREQQTQAYSHAPFASGQCTSCHDPHGSRSPPSLKVDEGQVCFVCHQSLAQALSLPRQHVPFTTGNCGACHDPHASQEFAHLKANTQTLCFSCHAGAMAKADPSHKPVREGWCTSCHDPHASKHDLLRRAAPGELCLTCHRK